MEVQSKAKGSHIVLQLYFISLRIGLGRTELFFQIVIFNLCTLQHLYFTTVFDSHRVSKL